MHTDLEIARNTPLMDIEAIAARAGIDEAYLERYGRNKAKVSLKLLDEHTGKDGKLVLVTAITPTPAARRTRVMTIPCGYGDGYPRILSGRADVLVNGRRAPVIGNICMDMMMADVTDAGEITPESEVVLLGAQGGERITPDELARLAETIPYEIMLGFSQRVARRFA